MLKTKIFTDYFGKRKNILTSINIFRDRHQPTKDSMLCGNKKNIETKTMSPPSKRYKLKALIGMHFSKKINFWQLPL